MRRKKIEEERSVEQPREASSRESSAQPNIALESISKPIECQQG